jgi:hypothetical protein
MKKKKNKNDNDVAGIQEGEHEKDTLKDRELRGKKNEERNNLCFCLFEYQKRRQEEKC